MWSRFKKRFFGGSRKTADDAASLDETIIHSCVLTDADDVRKSRQTLKQFANDDLLATSLTAADRKAGCGVGGGGGAKLKRKLSWFGGRSRRTTKSMTSLNSDKRRSGDDMILASKTPVSTTSVSASVVQTSVSRPTAVVATTTSSTVKPSSAGHVVEAVVHHVPSSSSKTSSSLLTMDKSLLVSHDDVWCSRVTEFSADKGTFGASSTSHIEELQRPVSLPPSSATELRSSPPKLKRRAKAASQSAETRKRRLSKSLPEPDPSSSLGERSSDNPASDNPSPITVETPALADVADATTHLKSNAAQAPSNSSGRRVPPPVPVRKYPPSSTAENPPELASVKAGLVARAAVEDGQVSPSPTRNSPDSGSDDTEGKESGYVTLDDLQAQLMRSSWSSDERDVIDLHSNNNNNTASTSNHLC